MSAHPTEPSTLTATLRANGRSPLSEALEGAGVTPNADYVRRIPMQAQRQDSLVAQLETVHEAATRLGCYDAADWIWLQLGHYGSVAYGEPSPTHNGSSGAQ